MAISSQALSLRKDYNKLHARHALVMRLQNNLYNFLINQSAEEQFDCRTGKQLCLPLALSLSLCYRRLYVLGGTVPGWDVRLNLCQGKYLANKHTQLLPGLIN